MTRQEKKRKKYLEGKSKQEGGLTLLETEELIRLWDKEREHLSKMQSAVLIASVVLLAISLVIKSIVG